MTELCTPSGLCGTMFVTPPLALYFIIILTDCARFKPCHKLFRQVTLWWQISLQQSPSDCILASLLDKMAAWHLLAAGPIRSHWTPLLQQDLAGCILSRNILLQPVTTVGSTLPRYLDLLYLGTLNCHLPFPKTVGNVLCKKNKTKPTHTAVLTEHLLSNWFFKIVSFKL